MGKPGDIIIGAGISGLSCAHVIKDCVVLEKMPYLGGLCNTIQFNDFRFDLGGHRFFTPDPKMEKLVKDLLGGKLIESEKKSRIYKDGKFMDYPLRLSIIFQLDPLGMALSFFTYIYRKFKPIKGAL